MWMWCRTKAVQWKLSEKLSVFCHSGICLHHLWCQKEDLNHLFWGCVSVFQSLAQTPHNNRLGKADPASVLKPQSRGR